MTDYNCTYIGTAALCNKHHQTYPRHKYTTGGRSSTKGLAVWYKDKE